MDIQTTHLGRLKHLLSSTISHIQTGLQIRPGECNFFLFNSVNNTERFEASHYRAARIILPSYHAGMRPFFLIGNPFLALTLNRRSTLIWQIYAFSIIAIDYLYCEFTIKHVQLLNVRLGEALNNGIALLHPNVDASAGPTFVNRRALRRISNRPRVIPKQPQLPIMHSSML